MHFRNQVAVRLTAGLLLVSTCVVPALAVTGTVNTGSSTLRVRSEANTSSTVLDKLSNGTKVDVISTTNGWYKISYEDLTGYVSSDYLILDDAQDAVSAVSASSPADAVAAQSTPQPMAETTYGKVTASSLNVRSEPNTDSAKVGSLKSGKIVQILGQTQSGWYQIENGYISAEYVVLVDAAEAQKSSKGQEIADYALQFVGYPYVYGGSSPSGFDCSGFTSYVYRQFGYSLNRSAASQLSNGTPVSMNELQPGDLVLFKKSGTGSKAASHVGIYIGNNQFVHASTSTVGVIVSSLSEAYYTTGFVGGRRIV